MRIYVLTILLLFTQIITFSQDLLIDSLKNAAQKEHNITDKIDLLISLSKAYPADSVSQAISIANKALTLASQTDDNLRKGSLHLLLGNLAMQMDSINRAEEEYKLAVKYLNETEATDLKVRAMTSLGNRYVEKESYPDAMDQYLKGISILEKNNPETKLLANLYNNLGVVYLDMNNPKKALDLYSKALLLFEKFGDTMNVAGATTNIGSIYIQLGNYDIARDYYKNGLRLFEKISNKAGQAHALFKLGLLEEAQQNNDKALSYLLQSAAIQKEVEKSPSGSKTMFQSETDIHIGINYLALNDIPKANRYLKDGLRIALQTNQYSLISMAAKYLSQIEKRNKNYQRALEYYELYKQYSDST